jgi:plasmid maintenance system antidote protein VapI
MWLKQSEISAAELARRCEYDRSNMGKVLKGSIKPTLDLAFRIERATDGAIRAQSWAEAA